LHDVINNLRQKLARQIKQYREENQTLTADYKRIVVQHFAIVDAEHFLAVWLMNEEEAKQLIRKAFNADSVIHAQQLGLHWIEPDSWFLHNVGPIVHCKKMKSANELAQEVIKSETSKSPQEVSSPSVGSPQEEKPSSPKERGKEAPEAEPEIKALWSISAKTVKHILELLCDESGFLIESKLRGLLQPLEKADRTLMKLDSIFSALSIDSEEDVYQMTEFFLSFKAQQAQTDQDVEALVADMMAEEELPEGEDREADASEEEASAVSEEEVKDPVDSAVPLSPTYMHPNDILKALKAFMVSPLGPIYPHILSSPSIQPHFDSEGKVDHRDGWTASAEQRTPDVAPAISPVPGECGVADPTHPLTESAVEFHMTCSSTGGLGAA
ncbi:hypothetical protein JD844_025861, partial [Phrynosoma platyrhinos]